MNSVYPILEFFITEQNLSECVSGILLDLYRTFVMIDEDKIMFIPTQGTMHL